MSNIFNSDNVFITDQSLAWKEAIELCAKPLMDEGYIDFSYIESIYEMAEKLGPYFDFGQGIAVPHARPQEGVHKTGAALLKVDKPVLLMDDESHPIDVIVVFASVDDISHIEILKEIATVFGEKDNIDAIKSASTVDEILEVFNR